jgi:hypothetical protein
MVTKTPAPVKKTKIRTKSSTEKVLLTRAQKAEHNLMRVRQRKAARKERRRMQREAGRLAGELFGAFNYLVNKREGVNED